MQNMQISLIGSVILILWGFLESPYYNKDCKEGSYLFFLSAISAGLGIVGFVISITALMGN